MTTALKVFVFAATAYLILKGIEYINMAMMSDAEKTRISLLPSDYVLKRHKGLIVLELLMLLCKVVSVGSLAVAAFMWAVSA